MAFTQLFPGSGAPSYTSIVRLWLACAILFACAGLLAWGTRHRFLAWQQSCRQDTRIVSVLAISTCVCLLGLALPARYSMAWSRSSVPLLQAMVTVVTVSPVVVHSSASINAKCSKILMEAYRSAGASNPNYHHYISSYAIAKDAIGRAR